MDSKTSPRQYWGKPAVFLPSIDLTLVQRESYEWFLREGIKQLLVEVSPIDDFTGKNWTLHFGDYEFDEPKYTAEEALEKGVTYDQPLRVKATLINKQTGRSVSQKVFLGDIPAMTTNGTF